jgi:hypothetical protein
MLSRLSFCCTFFIALLFSGSTILHAQNSATSKAVTTGVIRGHIADPSGAMIPGAQVTLARAAGTTIAQLVTDGAGNYAATGVAPGSYIVTATAAGFAPTTSLIFQLRAGETKNLDLTITVLGEAQNVIVSGDDAPTVSIESDHNADAVTMKDDDLDALSDDPDELSNELTALAGPGAGPDGGSIYISGFSGGQLPPKSAIREIRINQNPYSAEYDDLGYGRIEILTKPGTDTLRGRFFMQGNDDAFNTGNPFTRVIPAYHSLQYNGSISGSIHKNASFFFNAEQRNNQNASVYDAPAAVLDTTTGLYEAGTAAGSILNPSTHTSVSPRVDVQLGDRNTVTLRYQFERYSQSGALGSNELPSQAYSSNWNEHSLQASDSIVVNNHIANEVRFQYLRDSSGSTAVSDTPTVYVTGDMYTGGASSQREHAHIDYLEFQDLTTMSAGAHALKFGTRLRYDREADATNANFNGRFTFSSLSSYLAMLNGQLTGDSMTQIAAAGGLPSTLTYTTGPQAVVARRFDGALFVQDDWKATKLLTLSGGLRWETQDHAADHSDWAPRVAFAYALDGHGDEKQTRTVLRGGYGFFYKRFSLGNILNTRRYSGDSDSQVQQTITNPTCFNTTSLSLIDLTSCGSSSSAAQTIIEAAPHYHSPYVGQLGLSLERQLPHSSSVSLSLLRSYGVHQMVTRNANAYLPGTFVYGSSTLTGTRPDTSRSIVEQYDSEGIYKQNQLVLSVNATPTTRLRFSGYYDLNSVRANTGTASNSYDLKLDYGRPNWSMRHMLYLSGRYTAPMRIVFDPFVIAQSGKPYNYVSPYDLTGDNFFNSRPALVAASNCASGAATRYAQTTRGCFDMIPTSDETLVPYDMGHGPAELAFNLRIRRAFGFGPKLAPPENSGGDKGFHPINGMDTGHKYTLAFSAQALNLFNDIVYGTPVGTVNSSFFGQSTSMAGGIFSSGSAARRVFLQTVFSF